MHTQFQYLSRHVVCLAFIFCSGSVLAESSPHARDLHICAPDGVALGGYDVISYYQQDGPILGLDSLTASYNNLTYRFSNAENMALFLNNPDEYLPTYLGWCSTNLAMGRLACPDYTNFKIEDGRLLLFEHAGFTNGRDVWNTDPTNHRRMADTNFQRFSEE